MASDTNNRIIQLAASGMVIALISKKLNISPQYVRRVVGKALKNHVLEIAIPGRERVCRAGAEFSSETEAQPKRNQLGEGEQTPTSQHLPKGMPCRVHSWAWRTWIRDTGRLIRFKADKEGLDGPGGVHHYSIFRLHTPYGIGSIEIHFRLDKQHSVTIHLPNFPTSDIERDMPAVERTFKVALRDWMRNTGVRFGNYTQQGWPEFAFEGISRTLANRVRFESSLPDGVKIDFSPKEYSHDKTKPELEYFGPKGYDMATMHQYPERGVMMLAGGQDEVRLEIKEMAGLMKQMVAAIKTQNDTITEALGIAKKRQESLKEQLGGYQ